MLEEVCDSGYGQFANIAAVMDKEEGPRRRLLRLSRRVGRVSNVKRVPDAL